MKCLRITLLALLVGVLPAGAGSIAIGVLSYDTLIPGAAGPVATAPAQTVTTIIGSSRRVTFLVPAALVFASPTPYLVSLAGTTSDGTAFASSNKASITINPPAKLLSVAPNAANQGQSVTVTLKTEYTDFLQGSTRASFGPGISVGGAPPGTPGPVTVVNPATAVAQLVVDAAATAGPRTVSVMTGLQQASLADGFTVVAASQTPVLTSVTPGSGQQGQGNLNVAISGQFTATLRARMAASW